MSHSPHEDDPPNNQSTPGSDDSKSSTTPDQSPTDEKPPRKRTAVRINHHAYECGMETVKHSRQALLLDWLHDPAADSVDILDWLTGEGFVILRLEDPTDAILESLPPIDNPVEPDVRRLLAKRLAECINWLAADDIDRSQYTTATWSQIFELANQLNNPTALTHALKQLLHAFDSDGTTPFPRDHQTAIDFTRLIISHQSNNSFKERWQSLIKGESDTNLSATLFTATRGLFSMPDILPYNDVQASFDSFCTRIATNITSINERSAKAEELIHMVCHEYGRYNSHMKLAFANIWTKHKWLPKPDSELTKIVNTSDRTELSLLAQSDHQHADVAILRYCLLCNGGIFSEKYRHFIVNKVFTITAQWSQLGASRKLTRPKRIEHASDTLTSNNHHFNRPLGNHKDYRKQLNEKPINYPHPRT